MIKCEGRLKNLGLRVKDVGVRGKDVIRKWMKVRAAK